MTKPRTTDLSNSIDACVKNARGLIEDAEILWNMDRFPRALALAILAQEEAAKAFLLQLVKDDALPWCQAVLRSLANHESKHLAALVLEWTTPADLEGWLHNISKFWTRHEAFLAWSKRCDSREACGLPGYDSTDPVPEAPTCEVPDGIADALNIYRHEKIELLSGSGPYRDEEWANGKSRRIADGLIDKKKQATFYVALGKTGQVISTPDSCTSVDALRQIQQANRLIEQWPIISDEYSALRRFLPLLFDGVADADGPKDG